LKRLSCRDRVSISKKHRFIEKNIRTDLDAMQEMVEMNSQSTPTTVIDGEVIVGLDKEKISEMLGL
jgi:protein-disulfide isomerase